MKVTAPSLCCPGHPVVDSNEDRVAQDCGVFHFALISVLYPRALCVVQIQYH